MRADRTVYIDANVVSKLARDQLDLLRDFESKLTDGSLRVVPATDLQLWECLRTPDEEQRLADIGRLHRWTAGLRLGSHNDVMASYIRARLTGAAVATSPSRNWEVGEIYQERERLHASMEEWSRTDATWANTTLNLLQEGGVKRHAGNALEEAGRFCISTAKELSRRPEKLREFLARAPGCDALYDADAERLGADSWVRFIYAFRLFLPVHACFAGVGEISESRHRSNLGDWHHAVYARTATHAVTDDQRFAKRWKCLAEGVGEPVTLLAWPDEFADWLKTL